MINVSVPDELAQLVADLPEDSRRSLDAVLREAIEDYLWEQKHGDAVLQRLADIDAGRTKTIPLEQVLADYGLDD